MDQVHVLRHKLNVEKKSVREVARELGRSRNTIKKYAATPIPERKPYSPRSRPVADAIRPHIDRLLADWRGDTTRKQRITAVAVHDALVAEGYKVGITTVRDYLRELKQASRESFIPLDWRPGDAAQFDFFEVTVRVGDEQRKAWLFLMRMPYSGRDFVALYERCDQLSFLDGHVRAFAHFGAVPNRIIYDNLKPAVKRLLRDRELSARFEALSKHYLFEPCFARPGEGHDKGSVEARGKGIRGRFMVPVPSGDTLEELSEQLQAKVGLQNETRADADRDGETAVERFTRELPRMLPLPSQPFEARRRVQTQVTTSSRVKLDGAWYSVPSTWVGLSAMCFVGVRTIEIRSREGSVSAPRQPFGGSYMRQRHYLAEFARKPQAVRQNAALLMPELGGPYPTLWRNLVELYGPRDAARHMARVFKQLLAEGESVMTARVEAALRADSLERILLPAARVELPTNSVPPELAAFEVESTSAARYDALLAGGGWHE